MPNRHDDLVATARELVDHAQDAVDALESRRFSQAQQDVTAAADLAHDLQRRIHAERQARGEADGEAPNPYRHVLVPGPTLEDGLRLLSLEDLREHLRHENWRLHHHPDAYGRWWISKHFSSARRELVGRGEAPDAWTDGTEADLE